MARRAFSPAGLALGGDAVRAIGQPILDFLLAFLLVWRRLSGGRLAERGDPDSSGEKCREGSRETGWAYAGYVSE